MPIESPIEQRAAFAVRFRIQLRRFPGCQVAALNQGITAIGAPLFSKDGDVLTAVFRRGARRPRRLHWARAWAGLAAPYHPVGNTVEIPGEAERTQGGLVGHETHRRRRSGEVRPTAVVFGLIFGRDAEPDIRVPVLLNPPIVGQVAR